MWRTLCHPNVLPLLGVTMTTERFVMVLEWMDNGNITKFLKNHPDANRLTLVSLLFELLSLLGFEYSMIAIA